MVWILGLWLMNFAISAFNAWGCGLSWNETKIAGGIYHFMNWMGAIMSASGFTWCYTLLAAFVASHIPIESEDDGTTGFLLNPESAQALLELGYLIVLLPILGSGLAITLQSWAYFWRKRTFGRGVVAGYNTFAQVHNFYSAAQNVPGVVDHLGNFFGGDSKSDEDEDRGRALILILALMAACAGIVTTYTIVRIARENAARQRLLEYGK